MGPIGIHGECQVADADALAAGDFSEWLVGMRAALRGDRGSDVPCGGCTACCTASQFIHIAPDETETLARIPKALLFPAPLMPAGHVVLGHDERGHCPMLVEGRCSIYADRPRACRTYDCRVFAATGLAPEDGLIAERARRWRFTLPGAADHERRDAVHEAAVFIRDRPRELPDGAVPANATQHAVLAVEMHQRFLR
ncbi:MAG TPA: YkgJ family cysteine cluster protein [Gaiellales bacterium]|jgi:Fe-S-cluster containining protein